MNSTEQKYIENVCTGNVLRSRTSEFLMNHEFKKHGSIYLARSSGTIVKAAEEGDIPLDFMKQIIDRGLFRDIYDKSDRTKIESMKDEEVPHFYQKAIDYFSNEEMEHLEVIEKRLKNKGFKGEMKTFREQTEYRPDNVAVLAMDSRNLGIVKEIYRNGEGITLDTLPNFSKGLEFNIPNTFGNNPRTADEVYTILLDLVPKSVEKVMELGL